MTLTILVNPIAIPIFVHNVTKVRNEAPIFDVDAGAVPNLLTTKAT